MNKFYFRMINLFVLLLLVAVLVSNRYSDTMDADLTLSCRNELYDRNGPQDAKHYLIADFVLKQDQASISYRYFGHDGKAHSRISMTGQIVDGSLKQNIFEMAIDKVNAEYYQADAAPVPHMQYLNSFAKSNLANVGSHNLTLRLLERNDEAGYAAVFFQPSNAVCGCRLVD
ncbi:MULTISPECIES: hypothetical protein [Ferrimonas]|uniref:hypothetical protein n=1 Tax=Ferrimonas TaxID=44011 RepID=UPI00048272F6|nr:MULTISPECIES: hypothetical protein [Ferrimonas]USD35700.1 hypothetical protein J8Z22_11625 [Ferrimonas sp. SCSIO 43195]